jgi:ferredoxin
MLTAGLARPSAGSQKRHWRRQKPRYVDVNACTSCRQCEYACPIDLPSPFDRGLGATRAIRVPFSTAVPQKAVIDIDNCLLCGKCETACPVDAIDFTQQAFTFRIETEIVMLSTGFQLTPIGAKREYGGGQLLNVIDGLMMEWPLAPTGPYGHVLRPSDGEEPESIAYVQCAGSRDQTLGVGYAMKPGTPDTIILAGPTDPYVCIGYHQELEKEVDVDYCREHGLPIYRREVGGGAVYLDQGQVFTQWIFHGHNLPASLDERFALYIRPLVDTYQSFGIPAHHRPVNDIHVQGKKSGARAQLRWAKPRWWWAA